MCREMAVVAAWLQTRWTSPGDAKPLTSRPWLSFSPTAGRTRGNDARLRAGWLPGAGWRAVTADDRAVGAVDLAGAVGVDGEGPAEFVQDDVVVPVAVIFEVGEAGVAAVGSVLDVVGLTAGGGLVAAARMLPLSTQEAEQASWMTC